MTPAGAAGNVCVDEDPADSEEGVYGGGDEGMTVPGKYLGTNGAGPAIAGEFSE